MDACLLLRLKPEDLLIVHQGGGAAEATTLQAVLYNLKLPSGVFMTDDGRLEFRVPVDYKCGEWLPLP